MYMYSMFSMYSYLAAMACRRCCFIYWVPPAMEAPESRLGRTRSPSARFLCCRCCTEGDGGASALRAQCPLPMGTRCASTFTSLRSLWRLQRNEPGWLVGEHMQVRRVLARPEGEEGGEETLTDLTGEPPAESLTRLSDAEW